MLLERWCIDIRYIEKHRIPEQLLAICEALDIEKEYIHAHQSWENLVETHFNVMRHMSQVRFEQVTSWQGAKFAHERFVTDYDAQPHWAHSKLLPLTQAFEADNGVQRPLN